MKGISSQGDHQNHQNATEPLNVFHSQMHIYNMEITIKSLGAKISQLRSKTNEK